MPRKKGQQQQSAQAQQQRSSSNATQASGGGRHGGADDGRPYQRSARGQQPDSSVSRDANGPRQPKLDTELDTTSAPSFDSKLRSDAWSAILMTSMEFVINDLRKRQKQFLMSMLTVMLTVSFITLVDCLCQLTPVTAVKTTVQMSGDFDFIMMADVGRLKSIQGNTNFYTDQYDLFNARHFSTAEKENQMVEQSFSSWLPFVNFTYIAEDIDAIYAKKDHEQPVGLFPRWFAQTKLENPREGKFTSAYMIAGDSNLERIQGVAPGFPHQKLNRGEAITTKDVLSVLGAEVGDQITMNFDFFQMISMDFNKLKRLAYDFENMGQSQKQGEAILNFLKMPPGATIRVRDVIGIEQIRKINDKLNQQDHDDLACVKNVLDFVAADDFVRLADLIEVILPCTTPEIFTMRKSYTITHAVEDSMGKWPNQLGNGWFTESEYLVDDLIDMIVETVPSKVYSGAADKEQIEETLKELGDMLKSKKFGKNINHYAMQVAGKFHNREQEYVYYAGDSLLGRGKLRLMEVLSSFLAHLLKHDDCIILTPFIDALEKVEIADFQVGSVLLTVVVFLFILDFIVIYTIMLSDVDERTYDFAMLRCLGFKNSSLVVLLLMQALLYSIPATAIGFLLLENMTSAAQIWLYQFVEISLSVTFRSSTYYIGFATGIGVPLLSNILPIRKALGTSLRDALDKSRAGVNEQEVQVVRMENAGVNQVQMSVACAFLFVSFLTLFIIPYRTFNVEMVKVYSWLNVLLILVIIGFIFTSQAFAPGLSRLYLKAIICCRPKDRLLLPLIEKNLESHGLKNMKANLMYTVALSYLVFAGSNFVQISNFMKQMYQVSFGSKFALKSLQPNSTTRFDQHKIETALATQHVDKGGFVESHTMVAGTISTQFRAQGREVVNEHLLGIGLSPNKNKINNLQFQAIDQQTIPTMMKDEVWFPGQMLDQPLGDGTKHYDFDSITEMLYDIAPYSTFEEPFDPIGILSGQPNSDKLIKGEVINMITPACFEGEIYQDIGDYFSYCVSSPSQKRFGDIRYAPDSCQVKFKARAVASFNKMPGFPKITGYKSALQIGGNMLATDSQITSIIDRLSDTFPEFAKTREIVVADMPQSKNNLIKESVHIAISDKATKNDRLKVQNLVLANIEETQFLFWDMQSQFDDLDHRNKLVRFLHTLSSLVCLILGAFQLVVTVSANISDSMWELGVLRSMGCTRRQITSVIVYELMSTTMAAITLGYICGVIVSVLSIAIFHIIVELPMTVDLPTGTLIKIGAFALLSMIAGAKYGTAILFKKNIASTLKGT